MSQPYDGVIFLPGLMCDERLFAPQCKALMGRVETQVADLSTASSMESMAASVLEQTKFKRFALAGLSMGGALAMTMARLMPERIERLAILDANPYADEPERVESRKQHLEIAKEKGLEYLTRTVLTERYLAPVNQTKHNIDLLVSMAERHGLDVFERQLTALINRRESLSSLGTHKGRTLILCGELDLVCLPQWHEAMADAMPGSNLVEIPGCGHISTLEEPEKVNTALFDWLELQ